jgi:hypothetical protein
VPQPEPGADAGALFVPDGDRYVPTALGTSPWNRDSLHGGAPAALLSRAIERHDAAPEQPMQLVRVTMEILRPVPLAPLRIETRTIRPGRRVQLVESRLLTDDGTEVTRATGMRLRVAELPLPDAAEDSEPPPPPPEAGHDAAPAWEWPAFHSHALDIRAVRGDFIAPGPCTAWFRLRVPVVPDEDPSPVMRVAAAADFGNGISQVLPMQDWIFINPDLTFTVSRPPTGEWVCLDAASHFAGDGAGFAESALYAGRGRIGRAVQSLLLDRR